MSNFILTSKCSKNCNFCFAKTFKNSKEEFDFELLKSLIKEMPKNEPVRLLGGEPTDYSYFKELMLFIKEEHRHCLLISNFLFDKDILQFLIDYKSTPEFNLGFLINSSYLLENKKNADKFIENYNSIYSVSRDMGTEESLACGITIEPDKFSVEYYLEYIDFLVKNLIKVEQIRLSLAFPDSNDNKEEWRKKVLNNKKIGKYFLHLTKKCIEKGIAPLSDCILLPCFFETKEELKYIRRFYKEFKSICVSTNVIGPTDLLPDGTAIFCFPTLNSIFTNYNKENINNISSNLTQLYLEKEKNINLPEECKKCNFLKTNSCHGPCIGAF